MSQQSPELPFEPALPSGLADGLGCPQCESVLPLDTGECLTCGIVVAKWKQAETPWAPQAPQPTGSLSKRAARGITRAARFRVEGRLGRPHSLAMLSALAFLLVTVFLLIAFSLGMGTNGPVSFLAWGVPPENAARIPDAGRWAAVVLVQWWLLSLAVGLAIVTFRIYRRMA